MKWNNVVKSRINIPLLPNLDRMHLGNCAKWFSNTMRRCTYFHHERAYNWWLYIRKKKLHDVSWEINADEWRPWWCLFIRIRLSPFAESPLVKRDEELMRKRRTLVIRLLVPLDRSLLVEVTCTRRNNGNGTFVASVSTTSFTCPARFSIKSNRPPLSMTRETTKRWRVLF